MKNLTWQNPEQLFVAQELINKVKSKCCGIKVYIKTSIEGVGGSISTKRGLYIDLEFKDKKNFEKATARYLKDYLENKIRNKSCIAMPVVVVLVSLEKD